VQPLFCVRGFVTRGVGDITMRRRFIVHVGSTFFISIVQQIVGLLRHVLIAAFFGISRKFDSYLVIYLLATLLIFNLAQVFDSVAVPRLVRIKTEKGLDNFWMTSNRLLAQASIAGFVAVALFAVAIRLLMPVVAAGFSIAEREYILELSAYFLPWTFIIIPYYALAAHLKALWQFHWVFGAELLTMIISIGVLLCWHLDLRVLPIAYFAGYLSATLVLLVRRGLRRTVGGDSAANILPAMANQHLANQSAGAAGLVERYFQSFLNVGGISAIGYAGQIVNNLSSLLTFREIYVVPLAEVTGRTEKLERVLKGIALISIPAGVFVVAFAEAIVRLLFERGKFTAEAGTLTAGVLKILAVSLILSSILPPMARLFQIVNKVIFTYALYAVSLVGTVLFQFIFVFLLRWDVEGVAWAMVLSSALTTVVVALLTRYCEVNIAWHRVLGYAGYALFFSIIAAKLASLVAVPAPGLVQLLVSGLAYASVVACSYLLIHRRIRLIAGMA
jgi:putative peptidoglycan lipid II flippase